MNDVTKTVKHGQGRQVGVTLGQSDKAAKTKRTRTQCASLLHYTVEVARTEDQNHTPRLCTSVAGSNMLCAQSAWDLQSPR